MQRGAIKGYHHAIIIFNTHGEYIESGDYKLPTMSLVAKILDK